MAEQEQDRTEPATPFKLEEARRRGMVPKSVEVNSTVIVFVVLAMIYFAGERMITGLLAINRDVFESAAERDFDEQTLLVWFGDLVDRVFEVFWPLALAILAAAVLANFLQTGPVFSFSPLKPDLQKINPVQGAKRFFSSRLLFESVKNLLKLVLFSVVSFYSIQALLPKLATLVDVSAENYGAVLLDITRYLGSRLVIVMLLIALIDLQFVRWDYGRRLRMSRRELKEEVKRREGDPKIRAKIRQLQREASKRAQSIKRLPDADVLITNPTRLAVALKYDRATMVAPQVIAKGAGELALRMRQLAVKRHVPILENRELARRLFNQVDLDANVPEALYSAVAKAIVWAYRLKRRRDTAKINPW